MAFGPSGLSAHGAAPSQPVGNAPGQRRNNTLRAEGPPYHPRRWIGPAAGEEGSILCHCLRFE